MRDMDVGAIITKIKKYVKKLRRKALKDRSFSKDKKQDFGAGAIIACVVALVLPILIITVFRGSYLTFVYTADMANSPYLQGQYMAEIPLGASESRAAQAAAVTYDVSNHVRHSLPSRLILPPLQIASERDYQREAHGIVGVAACRLSGDIVALSYGSEPEKVAFLTFDDGPSRAVTPYILDILKEEGIRATFFVLPHTGVDDLYWRIIDEGHEIGNHTYTHIFNRLYRYDIGVFKDEVVRAGAFIYDNFGVRATVFRFPGGSMSWGADVISPRRAFVEGLGYRIFDWHIDSGDTSPIRDDRTAEAIKASVLGDTRNRRNLIILMHDSAGRQTTLEALPYIIQGLREKGYSFDIVSNYPR